MPKPLQYLILDNHTMALFTLLIAAFSKMSVFGDKMTRYRPLRTAKLSFQIGNANLHNFFVIPLSFHVFFINGMKKVGFPISGSPFAIRDSPFAVGVEATKGEKRIAKGEKQTAQKKPLPDSGKGFQIKRRRPPTLPHCIAVPSAQAGLTSLFGMGRGGTPPQ